MSSQAVCPICKFQSSTSIEVEDYEFHLSEPVSYFTCKECRSLYASPAFSFETLSQFYPKTYFSEKSATSNLRSKLQKLFITTQLQGISKLVSQKQVRFLDYGGGDGTFTAIAKKVMPSWEFDSYEPNQRNYEKSSNPTLGTHRYDVVRMHHVIEHIPTENLKHDLGRIFNLLKPGGLLLGETPNAESIEKSIFGKFWGGFHAPRHTFIFSKKSLVPLLESTGFTDVQVRGKIHPAQAGISLASAAHFSQPRFQALFCIPLTLPILFLDRLIGKGAVLNFTAKKLGETEK